MRHVKELISNNKAISIGLMILVVLVLLDGGIFFHNIMNRCREMQQSPQEEQKYAENKQH